MSILFARRTSIYFLFLLHIINNAAVKNETENQQTLIKNQSINSKDDPIVEKNSEKFFHALSTLIEEFEYRMTNATEKEENSKETKERIERPVAISQREESLNKQQTEGAAKQQVEFKKQQEELVKQQEKIKKQQEEIRKHQQEEATKQQENAKRQQEELKKQQEELRKQQEELRKQQEEIRKQQENEAKKQQEEVKRKRDEIEQQRQQQQQEEAKKQQEITKRQQEELKKQQEEIKRQQEEIKKQQEEEAKKQQEEVKRKREEIEQQRQQQQQEEAKKQQEIATKQQEELRKQQEEIKRQQDEIKKQQEEIRKQQQEEAKKKQEIETMQKQEVNKTQEINKFEGANQYDKFNLSKENWIKQETILKERGIEEIANKYLTNQNELLPIINTINLQCKCLTDIMKQAVNKILEQINISNLIKVERKLKGYFIETTSIYSAIFDKVGNNDYTTWTQLAFRIQEIMNSKNYSTSTPETKFQMEVLKNRLPAPSSILVFSSKLCIKNVKQSEYLFAAGPSEYWYDRQRRHVFTKLGGNKNDLEEMDKFKWKLEHIEDTEFHIKNSQYDEYLYVESAKWDDDRRFALTWRNGGSQVEGAIWLITCHSDGNIYIKNKRRDEYLLVDRDKIREGNNRYVFSGKITQSEITTKNLWNIMDCSQ